MPTLSSKPIPLSDAQFAAVMAAAAPLHRQDVEAYLELVAEQLRARPIIGDGDPLPEQAQEFGRLRQDCRRREPCLGVYPLIGKPEGPLLGANRKYLLILNITGFGPDRS